MIKMWKKLSVVTALCISIFSFGMTAEAKEDEKIESGIYVNDINLSGKTVSEAKKEVQTYVDSLQMHRLLFMPLMTMKL